jgi:hypothetical protein
VWACKTGSGFRPKYSVELVAATESGIGSGMVDDTCIGNCNEDTEKRCGTGFPYVFDKNLEAGLAEEIISKEFEPPSKGGVGPPNDVFGVVEVGKKLDIEVE